jgi:hypothetical protein
MKGAHLSTEDWQTVLGAMYQQMDEVEDAIRHETGSDRVPLQQEYDRLKRVYETLSGQVEIEE